MDIRERLLTALTWGEPDRVPLTIYEHNLSRGDKERVLREHGVGLVTRLPAHTVERRQVEVNTREYWENGRRLLRRSLRTPVGEVWQSLDPEGPYHSFQPWIKEHFIKGPDDYRVMEFIVRDEIYHENFTAIREAQRRLGGDGLVYVRLGKSPMQEMLYQMLGLERFAQDFAFRRDLFDSLYHTMCQRYEALYDLAVSAPVEIILMGDNITGDVVGEPRFRQYLAPVYKRIKERLAKTGKLLAVHMDGRLKPLLGAIADSEVDIVEALTPPPMGTVSVAEARQNWRNKALWLNFAGSLFIAPPGEVEAHTRELMEQAGTKRGFAIGVTEAAPMEALERSLAVIVRVLNDY